MKKAVALLFILPALALSLFGCAASGYVVYEDTAVFSDDIMFSARLYGGRSDYAYERMTKVLREIDGEVSLTDDSSDLSRFNAADAGVPIEVGRHCYEIFKLARHYYDITGGAFNAAAAPLVELWGLDAGSIGDYAPTPGGEHSSPELPTAEAVKATLEYCDMTLVNAVERDGKYTLEKSDARVRLDFGGIAKGYAADECAKILSEYGITSALIDISGNAYFYGDYMDGGEHSKWRVGVVAPRPRSGESLSRGYVCAFSTRGGTSAATSGDYNRYYIADGASGEIYVPHIIGADGVPIGVANSDGEWVNAGENVISATVISESGAMSDALSTAVASLGLDDGARLLQKVGCKGLIFTEKRFTIIGSVALYAPDEYSGYKSYEYVEIEADAAQ